MPWPKLQRVLRPHWTLEAIRQLRFKKAEIRPKGNSRGERLNDDGAQQVDRDLPPGLSVVELLEQNTPQVQSKESDEAETGANGDPEWCERVLDETERQVDDGDGKREHSDDPQVDGQMRQTVQTLDVTNTCSNAESA